MVKRLLGLSFGVDLYDWAFALSFLLPFGLSLLVEPFDRALETCLARRDDGKRHKDSGVAPEGRRQAHARQLVRLA